MQISYDMAHATYHIEVSIASGSVMYLAKIIQAARENYIIRVAQLAHVLKVMYTIFPNR